MPLSAAAAYEGVTDSITFAAFPARKTASFAASLAEHSSISRTVPNRS
jgi:hypothetical protein